MRHFLARRQAPVKTGHWILAGAGGFVAIGGIGLLTVWAGTPLLVAPFGATCVLLFSVANSPLSQPMNVVCGHVLSTAVALALRMVLPNEWWAVALAAGLAIALMAAFRVTHPPAGADPLVVFAADPGLVYLLSPVLSGSLLLVAIATAYHRTTGTVYPMKGQ
jgi:CBS-domain-containing membrane protein